MKIRSGHGILIYSACQGLRATPMKTEKKKTKKKTLFYVTLSLFADALVQMYAYALFQM